MSRDGIELHDRAVDSHTNVLIEANFEPVEEPSRSYPQADGGKDAWLFLAACFMIEALVWGFPFTFGLFQEYYSTHEPFASQGNTAVIGTCAMGLIYLSSPVVFGALRKWPESRRPCVYVGLVLMCIALAASSFAETVTHLILSQGVLYAMGGILTYSPCILFVDEWFIKRKGLAFGIMWAGTGLAGFAIPLVMQWLLANYGFRTALRAWSLSLFILTGPLIYWIKPRLPVQRSRHEHSNRNLFDLSFLLSFQYLIFEVCNIFEAFGFFVPGIYLPLFSRNVFGASRIVSALTVICLNMSSVFGCIAMGYLIDRYHVTTCILISTIGATASVLLLWGLSTNLTMLFIFCVSYGLFAGSFTSTWTGILRDVKNRTDNADAGLVFAFLAFGRGIGNVASGPLSEALVKDKLWMGDTSLAYGSGYGPLITFTGISALLGGCSFLARRTGHM